MTERTETSTFRHVSSRGPCPTRAVLLTVRAGCSQGEEMPTCNGIQ